MNSFIISAAGKPGCSSDDKSQYFIKHQYKQFQNNSLKYFIFSYLCTRVWKIILPDKPQTQKIPFHDRRSGSFQFNTGQLNLAFMIFKRVIPF